MRVQGPLEVKPGEYRSFDQALKKFKKLVEKEGTIKRVIERAHGYQKPSKKRHDARRRAKYNAKQNNTRRKRTTEIPVTFIGE